MPRTCDVSVALPPGLTDKIKSAYYVDLTRGDAATSQADWIERAVSTHARRSQEERRALTLRFPPTRYSAGAPHRPHNIRLSPQTLEEVQAANEADRQRYAEPIAPAPDIARHNPSDLITTALKAAIARSEHAAGGTLPEAPAVLPRRGKTNVKAGERTTVTISAPASFHRALADLHAALEDAPRSYNQWIVDTLEAWVALTDAQRATAGTKVALPTPRSGADTVTRRTVRLPVELREKLRPLEITNPRTILLALANELDKGLTLL